jgi:uncharacterized protein YkwD
LAIVGLAVAVLLTAPPAQAQETDRVLVLINQHRAENGLRPLTRIRYLDQSAYGYANDMATHDFYDRINHQGSDGSTPLQRVTTSGYPGNFRGEIIHAYYATADEVVDKPTYDRYPAR